MQPAQVKVVHEHFGNVCPGDFFTEPFFLEQGQDMEAVGVARGQLEAGVCGLKRHEPTLTLGTWRSLVFSSTPSS